MLALLRDRLCDLDALGGVRGRGFFIGVEFVADRTSKRPVASSLALHQRIRNRSLENGLICYPMGGNVDGVEGDTVIIAPPYNATTSELDEIVDKLDRSIRQALSELPARAS